MQVIRNNSHWSVSQVGLYLIFCYLRPRATNVRKRQPRSQMDDCDPMDCSTPGVPVHTRTHTHTHTHTRMHARACTDTPPAPPSGSLERGPGKSAAPGFPFSSSTRWGMRPPLGSWRWVFRMSVLVIITVLCQLFLALCSLRLPSKLSLLVGPAS